MSEQNLSRELSSLLAVCALCACGGPTTPSSDGTGNDGAGSVVAEPAPSPTTTVVVTPPETSAPLPATPVPSATPSGMDDPTVPVDTSMMGAPAVPPDPVVMEDLADPIDVSDPDTFDMGDLADPTDDPAVDTTDDSDGVDDEAEPAPIVEDPADMAVADDQDPLAADPAEDTGPDGTTGGMTTQEVEPLDCGPDGWAVENHGPPENRVNYVILADGYDATTINTTLEEHIYDAFERRFEHETGEPYGRYRKFVNICVMKAVSESNGIGNGPTAFGGGNGGDRLARVDSRAVNRYLDENLPERLEPSWTAVVLNQDLWENTGGILMLWSGGNRDAGGAALHEGGHGFHQLADEYGDCTGSRCGEDTNGTGQVGREYQEVNSTGDPMTTDGKWDLWLGSTQVAMKDPAGEATGVQSTFSGSRYEGPSNGQYRPSANSMMNSLFGLDPDTSYNSVSREQMVFSIWQFVRPIDSTIPEAGEVTGAGALQVNVVDPVVISVEWSVDGSVVAESGGTTYDTSVLGSGAHTVSARAYDNATEDLVRHRSGECPGSVFGHYCHGTAWPNNEQTVEWTVIIP